MLPLLTKFYLYWLIIILALSFFLTPTIDWILFLTETRIGFCENLQRLFLPVSSRLHNQLWFPCWKRKEQRITRKSPSAAERQKYWKVSVAPTNPSNWKGEKRWKQLARNAAFVTTRYRCRWKRNATPAPTAASIMNSTRRKCRNI